MSALPRNFGHLRFRSYLTLSRMAFLTPQFQIASDLHLETPLTAPQYNSLSLNVRADNLFLLGDIGLVVDAGLFHFLRRLLEQNRGSRIFYILGNHEAYRTTYDHAYNLLREFEQEAKDKLGGRFKFLCRDRYDLNDTITVLGCTLWSAIQLDQISDIAARSTDLNSERGIQNWNLERHQEEHDKDLMWLNSQVSTIENDEPHRQIMVATHYSPTTDSKANDPQHKRSPVASNFVTDLSQERCWLSSSVKLWAFGHTHYSCDYRDEKTGKLVVANQKGYARLGAGRARAGVEPKIVEAGKEGWKIVGRRKGGGEEQIQETNTQAQKEVANHVEKEQDSSRPENSLFHRLTKRIQKLRRSTRTSL